MMPDMMPDPLPDAGLRSCKHNLDFRNCAECNGPTDADLPARADQVNAWLVSLENGPLDLHRVLDAQELIRDLLAALDQGQLADDEAEKWHDAYQDAKRSADRNLAGLTAAITKLEAAEARLQALQPYVQHKSGCPALPANMKRFMSHGCTCGLATLTPGAASPERT